MQFLKKHQGKIIMVAITLVTLGAVKFVARKFPQVPLIGQLVSFL